MRAILWQIGFAVTAILTFSWISIWDTHSLTVLPLQAKYTLGFAKFEDLNALSNICFERKRYECSSNALKALITGYKTKNPVHYTQAIESHLKLGQTKNALIYINTFEKVQAPSVELLAQKAQLQIKLGEDQKALDSLTRASRLATGPEKVALIREQVNLLVKLNLFQQAQSKIMEVRRSSAIAHLFMEKELKAIHLRLNIAARYHAR